MLNTDIHWHMKFIVLKQWLNVRIGKWVRKFVKTSMMKKPQADHMRSWRNWWLQLKQNFLWDKRFTITSLLIEFLQVSRLEFNKHVTKNLNRKLYSQWGPNSSQRTTKRRNWSVCWTFWYDKEEVGALSQIITADETCVCNITPEIQATIYAMAKHNLSSQDQSQKNTVKGQELCSTTVGRLYVPSKTLKTNSKPKGTACNQKEFALPWQCKASIAILTRRRTWSKLSDGTFLTTHYTAWT